MKPKTSASGFLLLVFIAFMSPLSAQDKDSNKKVYTGTILRNDPENAKNLRVYLLPVLVDIYALNMNFGYSTGLAYRLNNFATLTMNYRKAYLDRINDGINVGSVYGKSAGAVPGLSSFEAGGQIHFVRKVDIVKESVHVKLKREGSHRVDYRAMVDNVKRLTLYGLDLSYATYHSFVNSENGNIDFHLSKANDPTLADIVYQGVFFSTMMHNNTISFGLRRTRISDIVLDIDGEGKKSLERMGEIYCNLLVGTGFRFDNMLITYPSPGSGFPSFTEEYVVNDNMELSKIGFRLGIQETIIHRFNTTVGLETGMKPGPKSGSDNYYLLIKFGLCLSAKV